MSTVPPEAPDLLAAAVTYLRGAMAADLGDSEANPKVWADFLPQTRSPVYPYAVVNEGIETYSAQTEAVPGHLSYIADGSLAFGFYSTSKAEAKALGRRAIALLDDFAVGLQAADARVFALLPVRAESGVIESTGPGVPNVYLRVVTIGYKQQRVE